MTIVDIIAACESEAGRLLRAAAVLRGIDTEQAPRASKPARTASPRRPRAASLAEAVNPRRSTVKSSDEPKAGKHDQGILHILEAAPVGLRCSDIAAQLDPRDKGMVTKAFCTLKRMVRDGVLTKEPGGIYKIAAVLLAVLLLGMPGRA